MIELSQDVIIISAVLLLSLFLGILIQRKWIPKLRKKYARQQNPGLRIFWKTIEGPIIFIFIFGSVYGLGTYFQVPSNSIWGYITLSSLFLLLITLTLFIIRLTKNLINFYTRKGNLPKTTIFNSIINLFILVTAFTVILAMMGISVTPIIGALGIGGLAVALALQSTLANLFAGISIIASKQLNPGDFVQISPTENGFIEDIQWRTTSIRTMQNNLIIIPNSQIANLTVTNYSLPHPEQSLPIPVGVHYDSDLDLVRDVCTEVAFDIQHNLDGAVRGWEPRFRFNSFGQSSIDLVVVLRINDFTQQFHIRSEFIRKLRKRFHEVGIKIPYPITTIEFADKSLKFHNQPDIQ